MALISDKLAMPIFLNRVRLWRGGLGVHEQTLWAIQKATWVLLQNISMFYKPDAPQNLVIYSVMDGTHSSSRSRHYVGLAFDIRIWHFIDESAIGSFVTMLQAHLGANWQIIIEKNHIHAEYEDPQWRLSGVTVGPDPAQPGVG